MPRHKRQHPLLLTARRYLAKNMPELNDAPLRMRYLDGPPGSPRYAVTVEQCRKIIGCPKGVSYEQATAGKCPVLDCPLRHTVRLLFDRRGGIVQIMHSGIHWG